MSASDLAKDLFAARRDDKQLEKSVPATLADAIALQRAVDALDDSAIVGYKAGATVAAALTTLKLDAPFHGVLRANNHFESGASVRLPRAHAVNVEVEFVVIFGQDLQLPAKDFAADNAPDDVVAQVAAAVSSVAPGFELVGTRFDMAGKPSGLALISDGAGNVATIAGTPVTDIAHLDLATHEAVLTINGSEEARGKGGDSLAGHPFAMAAWLLSQPDIAKRGIRAGECIYCGTCTGALPVKPGDELVADFGALGVVRVSLE